MKIKIKKINKLAKFPYKKHTDDFCYDLYATSCEEIAPNVYKYGFGIAMQIERGEEKMIEIGNKRIRKYVSINTLKMSMLFDIDIRPRSSVCKTGMVLSNSVGTIDEGYTGEISAVFYHVVPTLPIYKVGDRVAQMKIGLTLPIDFEIVEELKETERKAGGYGSTGLK